ncbi:MAG: helix-turn-helix domain-containing protein [Nitrospinota bacterium]
MAINVRKKIGQRIKEIRKRRGLTQEKLAEKTGVTDKFIGAVERGESFASFAKLEAISKSLDCDLRHFFEIDYMDESESQLARLIQKRVKLLSKDEKRYALKVIDWLANK